MSRISRRVKREKRKNVRVLLGLGLTSTAFAAVAGSLVWAWAPQIGNWTLSPQQDVAEAVKNFTARGGSATVPPEMPWLNPWHTAQNSSAPANTSDGDKPMQVASVQTQGSNNSGHGPLDNENQQPNVDHSFGLFSSSNGTGGGATGGGSGGSWTGTFHPNGGSGRGGAGFSGPGGSGGSGPAAMNKSTPTDGPNGNEPPTGGPNGNEPPTGGPNGNEPPTGGPNGNEPPTGGPNGNEPPTGGPNGNEPPTGGPNGNEPPTGGPNGNEPPTGGPNGDEPPTGGPGHPPQQIVSDEQRVAVVPEPGSLLMFLAGLLGLGWMVRRRA